MPHQEIAPITNAVHLCIDMQNIFGPGGIWETPWIDRVLPQIVGICEKKPERAIFTRFITPVHADDRPGQWQAYYQKWAGATREHLPVSQLELLPALKRFAPPGIVIDKPYYSAFASSQLLEVISDKNITTLLLTGAETDVCVLATTLAAVDYGFRVILVEDGLCSSSDEGHDALMKMYKTRLSEQIELIQSDALCALWAE